MKDIRAILAPMIEREVDLEREVFRVDRAGVLARMASAAGERRRWPTVVGLLAAAAVLLVAVSTWRSQRARETLEVFIPSGSAVHFESATGEGQSLAGSTSIPSRGALETGAGSGAQVTTPDGVAIELQSDTRVSLGALHARESRLDLRRGAVRCTVAHRRASHPFRVVAAGVTVVDLGTVFTVKIDETTHAASVSVEEGEVLVEHPGGETRLRAPGRWSSVEDLAAPSPAPPSASAPLAAPVRAPLPATRHETGSWRAPPPATTPPAATLDEESRLLRLGLAAERQGHAAEAISLFEQLLSRYPKSPLTPDAREALRRVRQSAQ
jgi:hypothetical protein